MTICAIIVLLVTFAKVVPVHAIDIGLDYAKNIDLPEAGDEDIRTTAVNIIKYLITFLGIIAVGIMLYGGFIWMTAAGNDDRVGRAKRIIIAGAIGLIVILASYAIVNFVFQIAQNAINGDI